ncbi:Eco57I restriction-modification methylase domain-containing protein [Pseudomonas oryzihabitans]|uniref:Eco57I restriction-modification methylase domain-containing protein n=1 Tax=Pseudomonas oryzihabitans TaxID=47885 RepID=UPI001642BCB0|nr:N-6 DNA methylase [Pseudomonas oryzihabitans]
MSSQLQLITENSEREASEFGSTLVAPSLQAHYTVADEILSAMSFLLGTVDGKTVLEPACGEGAFLSCLNGRAAKVDAIDVNAVALEKAGRNTDQVVNTIHADFLDCFVRPSPKAVLPDLYDSAIANPPYGLRLSQDYRSEIKRKFPYLYLRESFSLFLCLTIMKLKQDGRYVFIIPDTFLHSFYHRPTRRFIAEHGAISHIIQFKSSKFKTVKFGYGNLCIIAGNARQQKPQDNVVWIDSTQEQGNLLDLLQSSSASRVTGESLICTVENGWIHPSRLAATPSHELTLGDIADCKTGIYTGNNSEFLGFDDALASVRGVGHPIDWEEDVVSRKLTSIEMTRGICAKPSYVPIVKGGHRLPLEKTRWAIKWDEEALKHYKTDKKARYQNADYYFKEGLAVPMVTSGRISASLIEGSVFDQGVVGVFPRDHRLTAFLLIYLNSPSLAESIKRRISGSTNTSANYIKKIPIPPLCDQILDEANSILELAKQTCWEDTDARREALIASLSSAILPA